ncbi:hypothetical protein FE257_008103 [Aspergillus nanangensis]|uniref:Cytochrome P450 n=1 Tax=Aspergillus nanangensis TaxID=2582783 RepID=A0AAD4CLX1_ASPNN|nr:hypothetical protein FE257_008103 [Aspergillus nanangensis]
MYPPVFLLVLSMLIILSGIFYAISLPKGFPCNIPVIPFWRHTLDVAKGMSRADLYNTRIREPIEKHGAVARWHEGRWTILVTKPEFLVQIFKESRGPLTRQGFYHRVPGGYTAQFFGENIIDSDGDLHNVFVKLLRPGILRPVNITRMREMSQLLVQKLLRDQQAVFASGIGCHIGSQVWHWAVDVFGEFFLDTQMDDLDYSQTAVQKILGARNQSFIGRFRDHFPVIEQLPYTFDISKRTRARLNKLEDTIVGHAERRLQKGPPLPGDENKLIFLLNRARKSGLISDFHYRSNLNQLFVAGHENVETTLVAAMLELATRPDLQDRLFVEVSENLPIDYVPDDLDKLPLLSAVIYETLRLYPPLGTLTNRRTTEPFSLGPDILIPPGTFMGWHAYGVHTDPQLWGANAREFDPDRWGTDSRAVHSMFRSQQVTGRYIPFSLHSRRCLGVTFALTQLRVVLCELVRRLEWELSPDHVFAFSKIVLDVRDMFLGFT